MKTIGAFEAKTHLSELLDLAALGERVTITRRGKPIARLNPAVDAEPQGVVIDLAWLDSVRPPSLKPDDLGDAVAEMRAEYRY